MKIMFCLGEMGKGGAERVTANLTNKLIKENDVSIITTLSTCSAYELDSKIEVKSLDNGKKHNNVVIRNVSRIVKLKKYIVGWNPDLIISFLPENSYRVLMANFFNKKKIIVSVRNDPQVEYNTLFKKILMKILFVRANGFVFQTEDARQFFSKKIQDKSIIIPNPINPDFMIEPFEGERKKVVVNVGRLTEQKNQKMLINSFATVARKYDDYKLYIYGEGPLRNELQKQIDDLQLNDKVMLKGNVDNIKEEIYQSKMFVLSSDYEGMPNALMEAMSMGIPSIATDCPCGGPRFLIKNDVSGVLVPVNNQEVLTQKIIELIENEEKCRIISSNASLIHERLNPEKILSEWIKYIYEIFSNC